jgi:uncharacterized protein YidB (DUF937 family)
MGLFDQGLGNRNGLSPAAIALLGLLAVKGFENRDKLGGMLNGVLGGGNPPAANPPGGTPGNNLPDIQQAANEGGLGGLLGGLAGALGGKASSGSVVSGGLGDLLNSFRQAGHGDLAQSWVKDGPERQPAPQQVEQAVGPDLVDQLAKQTGLSRDELLARLTRELPKAVDQLTPDSRLPTEQEANTTASYRA